MLFCYQIKLIEREYKESSIEDLVIERDQVK